MTSADVAVTEGLPVRLGLSWTVAATRRHELEKGMAVEAVDHLGVADMASQSEEQSKIAASGSTVAKESGDQFHSMRSLDCTGCRTVSKVAVGDRGELGMTECLRHDRHSSSESSITAPTE